MNFNHDCMEPSNEQVWARRPPGPEWWVKAAHGSTVGREFHHLLINSSLIPFWKSTFVIHNRIKFTLLAVDETEKWQEIRTQHVGFSKEICSFVLHRSPRYNFDGSHVAPQRWLRNSPVAFWVGLGGVLMGLKHEKKEPGTTGGGGGVPREVKAIEG